MTTQTQGKGKKKGKDTMKVSLDEFNQIDAPHGHSVVSLKMTGLDWAETMADYDQQAAETQQIIVPAAPRAQRGPGIDLESLPEEPPFRVSVYNLPMSMEEEEVSERFFRDLAVIRVEISKSSTTVEFANRNDLYEALCKDGVSLKGRTVNVCLYGQAPVNNYSGYGSRGGGSSYGDRYGDRREGGGFGQRSGDRYGERSGGFGSRDRDREGGFGGFNRAGGGGGGFGGSRGYGDRGNFRDRGPYTSGGGEPESEEPANWRARPNIKPAAPTSAPTSYNNGSRQPYVPSRHDTSQHSAPSNQQYQQPEPYYQSRYQQSHYSPSNSPYPQNNNYQAGPDRSFPSSSNEERPKLVLAKRTTPLNLEDNASRSEAIFGKAKPSSTPYEKMKEVEEKLQAVQLDDKPPRK